MVRLPLDVHPSRRGFASRLAPLWVSGWLAAAGAGVAAGASPGMAPDSGSVPDSMAVPSPLPADSSTVWTAIHLPDGAILYVRYGEPGGVHIMRRSAGAESTAASRPAASAETTAPADEAAYRDMVLRILHEELGRLRAEAETGRATGAGRGTGEAVGPATGSVPPPAGAGEEGLVVVRRANRAGTDSLSGPDSSAVASPPVAQSRVPDAEALPPTLDHQVIREEFLDTGLFRTSLVLFETNRADLLSPSRDVLRAVGRVLQEFPEARLSVEGHCDPRGSAAFNLRLSRERAGAVRDYLVSELGIAADRIETVGYGEERPLVEGSNPTALTLNRRVEFRILNPEALERVVEGR